MTVSWKKVLNAFALVMLILAGCTSGEEESAEEPTSASARQPEAARPEQKTIEVRIEGTKEPMRFHLYEVPPSFPLAFSTYVPADMQVETVSHAELLPDSVDSAAAGEAVRIVAVFGGQRNEAAQVRVFGFPPDTDAKAARRQARDIATALGGTVLSDPQQAWAAAEYDLKGTRAGFLALGEHGGRWFYVLVSYPPAYGDGMAPRVATILRTWQWGDTGSVLLDAP